MAGLLERVRATKARFDARTQDRSRNEAALLQASEGVDLFDLNDARAVKSRLGPLGFRVIDDGTGAGVGQRRFPLDKLERILGTSDLISVDFLYQGARAARAVGRIVLKSRTGRTLGYGTGFLVSPRVLMTNNHVLTAPEDAADSVVEFDYHEQRGLRALTPQCFRLQPHELFVTHVALDFTLVAVEARAATGSALADRGYVSLEPGSGEPLVGESLNIIQHPGGQPQMVALRDNRIVDVVDDFFQYRSDTDRGSSGAPAFTDGWDLAALHHSGVPDTGDGGRILLRDGSPWDGRDDTAHLIRWKANEGIRLARIVGRIEQELPRQSAAAARLIASALAGDAKALAPVHAVPDAGRRVSSGAAPRPTESAATGAPLLLRLRLEVPSGPGREATTVGDVTVPLVVGLGGAFTAGAAIASAPPAAQPAAAAAPAVDPLGPDGQLYFDKAADTAAAEAYYEGIGADGDGAERFAALNALLERTHRPLRNYRTARVKHLYPWVDLWPDGQLRSIYSGDTFDPSEMIRLDLEVEAEHRRRLEEAVRGGELELESASLGAILDDFESRSPYNCEHVVPQSWFDKRTPMREDLHHLFTCEADCNSFRGNTPYDVFGPEPEALRDRCGRREGDRFEPSAGKGAVARATLYFLLRYPGEVGDDARELQRERLATILQWHRDYPVTRWEQHRNQAVAAIQGVRNPLIDHPEWADLTDFTRGFGK